MDPLKFLDSLDNPSFGFLKDMKAKRLRGETFSQRQLDAIKNCIPQAPVAPDGKYLVNDRVLELKTMRGSQKITQEGLRVSVEDPDVKALVATPIEFSKAFGRKFGVCGICHATLTNPESIALGIGPICRERFG